MRIAIVIVVVACGSSKPEPVAPAPVPPPAEDPVPPYPQQRVFEPDEASAMQRFSLTSEKPYQTKDGVTIKLELGQITCTRGTDVVTLKLGPFKGSTPPWAGWGEVVAYGSLVQMRGFTDKMVLYPAGAKLFKAGGACGDIDLARVQAALPRGMSLDGGHGLVEANGLCVITPVSGKATVVVGRYSGDIMLVYRAQP